MLSAVLKLLEHWASRLNVIASVAKYLLERGLEVFRFRGARFVREFQVNEIDSRTSIRNVVQHLAQHSRGDSSAVAPRKGKH